MTGDPWRDYLAAAQRLDAVRRGAGAASAEQDRAQRAAREELSAVRAGLAPQHARLRELGVPEAQLAPTPPELAGAVQAAGRVPGTALAALRQARAAVERADAVLAGGGALAGVGGAGPWLRNLVVYGPFAAVVLVMQLAVYLFAGDASVSVFAAGCGLVLAAVAFGLGWLIVGLAFPPGPGGKAQRTPLVGALVCLAPVVLTFLGAGLLALAG